MRKEKPGHHKGFDFTEQERLFERVTHERLLSILEQSDITIHEVAPSSNTYGEFLFVSLSKRDDPFRGYVTFWGLGYHDGRERWLTQEWFWFRSTARSSLREKSVPLDEAKSIIAQHKQDIETWAMKEPPQSERGQVFETLADLTDEDGAYSELLDMEALGGSIPTETSPEPAGDTEAAHLRHIKESILAGWQELPPEHQATMMLLLLKALNDDYYRAWLIDAIDELYRRE